MKKRRQIAIRKKIFELCIIIFIDGEMNIYIYMERVYSFLGKIAFRVFSKFLNSLKKFVRITIVTNLI